MPSKLEFTGDTTYPGCRYVGITTECGLEEIGERMAADFQKLRAWQQSTGVELKGEPFSVCAKWDLGRGRAKYTSGMSVAERPRKKRLQPR